MKLFVFLSVLFPFLGMGQHKGMVMDAESRSPLPFVNIGIPGENIGTVSNRNGEYALDLEGNQKGSLVFSMVGYSTQSFSMEQIPDTVWLDPTNQVLEEVVVRDRKLKKRFLGNKTSSKIIYAGYDIDFPGAECGIPIRVKKDPTFINTFHFFVNHNDYDSVRFRVNVYRMEGDSVGTRILNQQVLVEGIHLGWNHVNLMPYHLVASQDFLICLEWLTDFPCRKTRKNDEGITEPDCDLMFSGTLFGGSIFFRRRSQGPFERFGLGGIGFVVGIEQ